MFYTLTARKLWSKKKFEMSSIIIKRGRKTQGTKEKQRERDPTTAPTVPSPLVQLFPFVLLLPLSRPKNTPAPLPFHLLFIPSSSSLSQPPATSLVLEISVTEPPSLQQLFPLINNPPSSAHHPSPTRRATIEGNHCTLRRTNS